MTVEQESDSTFVEDCDETYDALPASFLRKVILRLIFCCKLGGTKLLIAKGRDVPVYCEF